MVPDCVGRSSALRQLSIKADESEERLVRVLYQSISVHHHKRSRTSEQYGHRTSQDHHHRRTWVDVQWKVGKGLDDAWSVGRNLWHALVRCFTLSFDHR